MARQVQITNPYGLRVVRPGDLSGSVQGFIKARTGQRGRAKMFAGGGFSYGNPNPSHKFPPGQSGNPKNRP